MKIGFKLVKSLVNLLFWSKHGLMWLQSAMTIITGPAAADK